MSPEMDPYHWNIIIFLFCSDLIDNREKYFNVYLLKVLFKEISSDIVFNCLKEIINMFYKLSIFGKKYTFGFIFEVLEYNYE